MLVAGYVSGSARSRSAIAGSKLSRLARTVVVDTQAGLSPADVAQLCAPLKAMTGGRGTGLPANRGMED